MSELWRLPGYEISELVRSKQISAVEVTKAHLDRLKEVNPKLNAVVQEMPDKAIEDAKEIDKKIEIGKDPGILCGVPLTIKVLADQKGFATTNGLKIQKDLIATTDSPIVSNVKKAGAVVIGRTNTPAFSLRWFTNNDLHGQTLNPHDKNITPGGSSGGASSAVASGICPIAHGTDIGGSIRYPAYACGLHGLRPTFGRIPAFNASGGERHIGGQIMAVGGPISRTMKDIQVSFEAMAASDNRDPWYVPVPFAGPKFDKRVAFSTNPDGMPVCDEVVKAIKDSAKILSNNGWQVEEVECPPMQDAADVNAKLWMAETRYAAKGMIDKEDEADSKFVFEQMTKRSPEIDKGGLLDALQKRATLLREWQLFLSKYPVLITPVSGELPFPQQLDVKSENDFENIMKAQLTQLAVPALGLPALSVFMGFSGTTPVGVQLIGARFREDILIAAGTDIESSGEQPKCVDPNW